jgi:hypothetical protein
MTTWDHSVTNGAVNGGDHSHHLTLREIEVYMKSDDDAALAGDAASAAGGRDTSSIPSNASIVHGDSVVGGGATTVDDNQQQPGAAQLKLAAGGVIRRLKPVWSIDDEPELHWLLALKNNPGVVSELAALALHDEVRKTPSWPRSWANFRPLIAVFPQECTGQLAPFGPT